MAEPSRRDLARERARDRDLDRVVRIVVTAAAAGAVLLSLPAAVTTVLGLLALVVVADRLVTGRRRGALDAVLAATAGTLVVLMLSGLALDLAGMPLRPRVWAPILAVVGILALVVSPPPKPGARSAWVNAAVTQRAGVVLTGWLLVAGAVAAGAVAVSWQALTADTVVPVQLSLRDAGQGDQLRVTVSGAGRETALQLRVSASRGRTRTYPLPPADASGARPLTVPRPAADRVVITLVDPGRNEPLRTLIVDR